ncbi:hypothetical protein [Agitococcus lubricus]|uniref:Uncharacterized protein n=1 Tax=Agitococcus lubricus TaxID=1077255 RepID=A0A2T5J1D5_9GAMM|nr:hypothetical protein [Agitococcus lubricus]PTQ90255.1 hypothetical protein C8N29_1037 [Agitococcus lubricus]
MTKQKHLISPEDVRALQKNAAIVRVMTDMLAHSSHDITINNKALFDMLDGMAHELETIMHNIDKGD